MRVSPIVLNLYDPENQEITKTYTLTFIPWKMLKKAVRLSKSLSAKSMDQFEETDIDDITNFILGVFPNGLTVDVLDEQSDLSEMIDVIKGIINRTRGIMDPTLPPKAP